MGVERFRVEYDNQTPSRGKICRCRMEMRRQSVEEGGERAEIVSACHLGESRKKVPDVDPQNASINTTPTSLSRPTSYRSLGSSTSGSISRSTLSSWTSTPTSPILSRLVSMSKAQAFMRFQGLRPLVVLGTPCTWIRSGQDRARIGRTDKG